MGYGGDYRCKTGCGMNWAWHELWGTGDGYRGKTRHAVLPGAARVHANHVVVAHRLRHKAEAFSHRSGVSGGRVVVGPSR